MQPQAPQRREMSKRLGRPGRSVQWMQAMCRSAAAQTTALRMLR